MQNIANARETIGQIGRAASEFVRGCEMAHTDFGVDTVDEMIAALREMLKTAELVRESMASSSIDPTLDHDGDTQPSNDLPDQPVCKCGHAHRHHMPNSFSSWTETETVHVDVAGCCIFCDCERFER